MNDYRKAGYLYTFLFGGVGLLFGLFIVVLGTMIALYTEGLAFTPDNIAQVHTTIPLLWLIDSLPLILVIVFGMLGAREDELRYFRNQWENTYPKQSEELRQVSNELAKQIKERDEFENVLSSGKRQWETIFDSVQDMIVASDISGNVIRCNRAAANVFQTGFRQLIGRHVDELFFGSKEFSMQSLSTPKAELNFSRLGGWYEVTCNPLVMGNEQQGWIYILRNVNDRKKADLDLKLQKEYYESLINNVPFATVTLDMNHKIVDCNQAFESMFGFTQSEVLLQDLDTLIAPPEMVSELHTYSNVVAEGEIVHQYTQRRRKDGSLVDVELFGIPAILGGKQIGILGFYHDLTDLKRTQREAEAARLLAVDRATDTVQELLAEQDTSQAVEEYKPPRRLIKIETIEGIGQVYAQKLAAVGIKTTNDLLNLAASRKGRQELVEQTGISNKFILRWVNIADLMRIPGIGEEYSELLEAGGVDTVKELKKRNAEKLHQTLSEINSQKKLARRSPSLTEVESWITHAMEIEPLLTY